MPGQTIQTNLGSNRLNRQNWHRNGTGIGELLTVESERRCFVCGHDGSSNFPRRGLTCADPVLSSQELDRVAIHQTARHHGAFGGEDIKRYPERLGERPAEFETVPGFRNLGCLT